MREELEWAQDLLIGEIGSYPTPISGCDAHCIRLIGHCTPHRQQPAQPRVQQFVATPRVLEPKVALGTLHPSVKGPLHLPYKGDPETYFLGSRMRSQAI